MTWHRGTCTGPELSFWAGHDEAMVTCLACLISKPMALVMQEDDDAHPESPESLPAPAAEVRPKTLREKIPPCPAGRRHDWPTHKARARAQRHANAKRRRRNNTDTTKKENRP